MLLDKLPDDCLLEIFSSLETIDDCINISKVCSRWKNLVSYRLTKVKALLAKKTDNDPSKVICIKDPLTLVDPDLHRLLPNLELIDVGSAIVKLNDQIISRIIFSNQSIKGFIHPLVCSDNSTGICYSLVNHENQRDQSSRGIYDHEKVTQIFFRDCLLSNLNIHTTRSKNLTRLHIIDIQNYFSFNDIFYRGPMLKNLKILELTSASYDGTFPYPGYHLMDFCPSLESAYFYSETIEHFVNESIKNLNLRDLVIEYMEGEYSQEWDSLRSLLAKFPNLKHLAIRGNQDIDDSHIEELIQLLPNISLIDFRESPNITKKSKKYIEKYCQTTGKVITFYYNCDISESFLWPKINSERNQICFGFDFMQHCFFRSFYNLPLILSI